MVPCQSQDETKEDTSVLSKSQSSLKSCMLLTPEKKLKFHKVGYKWKCFLKSSLLPPQASLVGQTCYN